MPFADPLPLELSESKRCVPRALWSSHRGRQPGIKSGIGATPSGKAADFDSSMRRFESSRPSQAVGSPGYYFQVCENPRHFRGLRRVRSLGLEGVRTLRRVTFRSSPPPAFTNDLMLRFICWHIQEQTHGGLDPETAKHLDGLARGDKPGADRPRRRKPGTVLLREYQGDRHTATVVADGYLWREATYANLSTIAGAITGTAWNGPHFFGLPSGGES
jgi:Protein of unknown function (DUF2924)